MGRHALVDIIVVGELDIASKLDIVVCELADLNIINTKDFLLFTSTKLENRKEFADAIKSGENQAGSDERICTTSKRVGDLVAELDPVVVQPATGNHAVTIEMRNVVTNIC